jgi:formylglycine-generating enzyme required for sulfatase activity
MPAETDIAALSKITESILEAPFEWCGVPGGAVFLENVESYGGTKGGKYQVADFAIAKYLVTNAQYEKFLAHPKGFSNARWWEFSAEAEQWRKDHHNPKPSAFPGGALPRTRVSWFDSLAFCRWLSAELASQGQGTFPSPGDLAAWGVRLPTEQEWQRAALGDSGWHYPWGDDLEDGRGNYAGVIGKPSRVGNYPAGQSIYGAMDMVGNVWEWCLDGWGAEEIDLCGYTYRAIRGGAWNVSKPEHLRADDRGGWPPRGRLNDAGFRCVLIAKFLKKAGR